MLCRLRGDRDHEMLLHSRHWMRADRLHFSQCPRASRTFPQFRVHFLHRFTINRFDMCLLPMGTHIFLLFVFLPRLCFFSAVAVVVACPSMRYDDAPPFTQQQQQLIAVHGTRTFCQLRRETCTKPNRTEDDDDWQQCEFILLFMYGIKQQQQRPEKNND